MLSAAAAAERAKAQRERAEAQLTQRLAAARRRRDLARGGIGSQEMMMRKAFILALTLSTLTSGAFAHDPTTMPETGRVALYVTGASGNGSVEIHRPAAKSHGAVTANAGRLEGGADDNAVTRQGAAQSNLVERTQRSVPASDGGDDDIRVLGPAEGPRCGVGLGDEAFDSGLERDEGVKNAALQCLVSLAKKPSTALSQEALVGV